MLPTASPQIADGILLGAIYALFATGYALVLENVGFLNFAHAALFVVGAMLAWWLTVVGGVPLPAAILLAALVAGVSGVLLELLAFARLRGRPGGSLRLLIAALALASIGQGLVGVIFGHGPQRYAPAVSAAQLTPGPAATTWPQLAALVAATLGLLVVPLLQRRTRFGRAARAVAMNQRAALLLGIRVERTMVQTLFLASALGGLSGALYGFSLGGVAANMGAPLQLRALAILVIGGMGSIPGAIVGGFLLALLESVSSAVVPTGSSDVVVFALLFLALLLRPFGLAGWRPRGEG